jgi:glycosyltransferase involved in cell wall biosynthesis
MTAVRVLHVLGTAEPHGRGVSNLVATLARHLDPSEYELHAWFLDGDGALARELEDLGVKSACLHWPRGIADPVGLVRFWRRYRREPFAIVHLHSGGRSVRSLIRSDPLTRLIEHLHGMPDAAGGAVAAVAADATIAASHAAAAAAHGRAVRVIHAGVAAQARRGRRDNSRTVVIGTACRLVPQKGVHVLLRSFAKLLQRLDGARLEIAGDGPQRAWLNSECEGLGISHAVKFLGWRDDVPQLMRHWDIFALPTLDEAFGLAALEAMAAGLPVIASRVGGVPELVDDGVTGRLVRPGDVDALADALCWLAADRGRCEALGAAGSARAAQHFSASGMAGAIEAVYYELLARKTC